MNTKTESTTIIAPILSSTPTDENITQMEPIQQTLQSPSTRKVLQVIKENNTIVPRVLVAMDGTFTPNSQLKKQILLTQSYCKPVKSISFNNLFSATPHKEVNHDDKENQVPQHINTQCNPEKVIMSNGSVKRKVISPLSSEKNELSRRDVSPTVQKTLEFSSPREKKLASRIIIRKHKTIEPPTANKTLLRFIF